MCSRGYVWLDQALKQYGPETKAARDRLKTGIVKGYETFWGGGEADPSLLSAAVPLANAQIAFAIFLILELGLPYTGLMRISPTALEQAIELVDK